MDRLKEKEQARLRRHHKKRMKEKYRQIIKEVWGWNERSWNWQMYGTKMYEWLQNNLKFYETRHRCSCDMYCNPRKSRHSSPLEKLTMQEKKFLLSMKEQLNEVD